MCVLYSTLHYTMILLCVLTLRNDDIIILQSRWVEFQERCEEEEFDDCLYAGFGYDAVWAVIHAINNSSSGDLYQSLGDITFSGVSVSISLN